MTRGRPHFALLVPLADVKEEFSKRAVLWVGVIKVGTDTISRLDTRLLVRWRLATYTA